MLCTDCGKPSKYGRCRSCSAKLRWARDVQRNPLPTCKMCGITITTSNRRRATYCSRACCDKDPASRPGRSLNRVAKICKGCGVRFEIPVSNASRYNYCSRACSSAHRSVTLWCERCGATFRDGVANRSRAPRRHCCETCRRPPVLIMCAHCSTSIRVTPSRESRTRYCSRRCYMASGAETGIERAVRLVLEGLNIDHVSQGQVGPWVVDFLLGQLVIEADGAYWHSLRPDVDRRKTADLEARGLTVWRIPEAQINGFGFADSLRERLDTYARGHGPWPSLLAHPDRPGTQLSLGF